MYRGIMSTSTNTDADQIVVLGLLLNHGGGADSGFKKTNNESYSH